MLTTGVALKTVQGVDSNFLATCTSWTKDKAKPFFFTSFLLVYNEPVRLESEHILTPVIKLFNAINWIKNCYRVSDPVVILALKVDNCCDFMPIIINGFKFIEIREYT